MTKLSRSLEGKKVRIITLQGEEFTGRVSDYISSEDNEPEGTALICIEQCPQRPNQWVGFNETEIESIEEIA